MSVVPAFDLQGLMAEDQWIRRLARKLAGDAHAAEDLVQDTWAAALDARGSARPRALRPWLRGILRNLWNDASRTRAARARRELRVARAEALEPTSELVAELELRKSVAEALLALEEPYRSALYLRFFRDQSLAAIAKHQGIAPSSAHERIQHGLARLRARLDRDHGGRRGAWVGGLLALARPAGATTTIAEAIAMAGGAKLAASVLLIGGGVAWFWFQGGSEGTRILSAPPPSSASVVPTLDGAPALPTSSPARAPVASEGNAAPLPSAEPEPEVVLVRGRVVDPDGAPLGSVRVGWVDGPPAAPEARSGADGSFALPDAPAGTIRCLEPELVTLLSGERASVSRSESTLIVAAPRASFGGVVVDPEGVPVAGAELAFGLRDALLRELGLAPSSHARPEWRTKSDASGAFTLSDVAGGARVLLQVEAAGYWVQVVDLPAASAADLLVVLQPSEHVRTIHGLVLDSAGVAVEGASISAGDAIVASAADGRFELVLGGVSGTFGPPTGAPGPEGGGLYLVALKRGLMPARERLAALDLEAPIVLQLGARPASITGHVREADGRPAAGIVLWPRDSTPFGHETVLAGEGVTMAWTQTVEDELAGGHGQRGAVSDAAGAFEVPGLLERPYELMAFDPERAELFGPWPLASGARGVELVLDRSGRRGRVAGRVVSVGGTPLAGVGITPQRQVPDTDAHGQVPYLRPCSVTTDAEGRFEFQELVREATTLQLQHPALGVSAEELAAHADPEHLELVEPLLCELQVESLAEPGPALSFAVLDAAEHELNLLEAFSGGWSVSRHVDLVDGLSPVVRAPETGRTLVLFRAGEELLRRPLTLVPGELTHARP